MEYASNTPISRPTIGTGFQPNVDLGGIGFSYKDGFCFPDGSSENADPIVLPSPFRSSFH
jgi:hypothetical protein